MVTRKCQFLFQPRMFCKTSQPGSRSVVVHGGVLALCGDLRSASSVKQTLGEGAPPGEAGRVLGESMEAALR
jgi:hypothetical protein